MARDLFINARFLAEPLTGLQRYGREVLAQFDAMLEEGEIDRGTRKFVLLAPRAPDPDPGYRHLELRVRGVLRSHAWEQLSLPLMARGFLLNLKNTAPVRHRRMAVVIHDLQVFAHPETHTGAFNAVYRGILPRAARRARAVFAPSESTAREIERHLGVPAALVTVTSEGHEHAPRTAADAGFLAQHGIEPGSYLLAVSSLNPNKNFAGILGGIRRAGAGELPLVIAGGANPRVFAGGGEQDLPPGALHVGRVGDAQLRALYENALAFVYPSFYEGFGLPPLEAMALGCPVICSNTTSLPEVGGDAVLYCNPADEADIARQIRRVVDDPHLRHELAAKGLQRAAQFSWRECARRIWRRIEPLLDE